jgi:phage terminase large subunit-like protein
MIAHLQADGLPCIPVQQTIANLSAPTKALWALAMQGKLRHGGNPILKWCASNAVVVQDHNENLRVSKAKDKSPDRVDGVSAIISALSVALLRPAAPTWTFEDAVILGPPRATSTFDW